MRQGEMKMGWYELFSLFSDGSNLRSNNNIMAGKLRPLPSLVMCRVPGASLADLLQFHRRRLQELSSKGSRFREGMSLDQAIQADRDYYQSQIDHWRNTGLLVSEQAS